MTLRKTDHSKEDCITHLQAYSDKIDQIFALFDDRGLVVRSEKEQAQLLLGNLKQQLKSDYKSRDTKRGNEEMTHFERAYLFPAIHEAYTSIYIKTNSRPSGKWIAELYDAQSTIKFYLHQLQEETE